MKKILPALLILGSSAKKRLSSLAKPLFSILFITIFLSKSSAQNKIEKVDDAAYLQTITQRSNKIVAGLGITDSAKFYRVQNILVQQYSSLNSTHDGFNIKVKSIKSDSTIDKKSKAEKIAALETERVTATGVLHKSYLSNLTKEITDQQIDKVKDGMTYNKLSVTYNAYTAMILTLTDEQKQKIKNYLIEAREFAMDAESADKKTEWFGKYKGKINNYLSAQGYDMKKEGLEWEKRIKEAKENKTN